MEAAWAAAWEGLPLCVQLIQALGMVSEGNLRHFAVQEPLTSPFCGRKALALAAAAPTLLVHIVPKQMSSRDRERWHVFITTTLSSCAQCCLK